MSVKEYFVELQKWAQVRAFPLTIHTFPSDKSFPVGPLAKICMGFVWACFVPVIDVGQHRFSAEMMGHFRITVTTPKGIETGSTEESHAGDGGQDCSAKHQHQNPSSSYAAQ